MVIRLLDDALRSYSVGFDDYSFVPFQYSNQDGFLSQYLTDVENEVVGDNTYLKATFYNSSVYNTTHEDIYGVLLLEDFYELNDIRVTDVNIFDIYFWGMYVNEINYLTISDLGGVGGVLFCNRNGDFRVKNFSFLFVEVGEYKLSIKFFNRGQIQELVSNNYPLGKKIDFGDRFELKCHSEVSSDTSGNLILNLGVKLTKVTNQGLDVFVDNSSILSFNLTNYNLIRKSHGIGFYVKGDANRDVGGDVYFDNFVLKY